MRFRCNEYKIPVRSHIAVQGRRIAGTMAARAWKESMRIAIGIVGVLALALVVVTGVSMLASESGEVVVLRTKEASGTPHETRVWIVDDGVVPWLRAGNPRSSWLLAIQRDPAVEVERGGKRSAYTAVPDATSRDRLNALFAAKYRWADAYIGALLGRGGATPIRLDPR